MSVALVIILSTLLAVLSSGSHSFALPACPGQRFYLKPGEGLTIEFSRRTGCDVRFMTVERGSVERQLFYQSGQSNTLALAGGQQDAPEAWSELPTKAYFKANSESVVRFLAAAPVQNQTLTPGSNVKPLTSNAGIRITFQNATSEFVVPFWINGAEKEISFGDLSPGASVAYDTFIGQTWGVKRKNTNQQIRRFTVSEKMGTIRIEARDLPVTVSQKPPLPPQPTQRPIASPFSRGSRITTIDAVNVRSGPTLSASISGAAYNGTQGTIVDGPHTQDGYTWWRVRYDNGVEGWTADKFIRVGAASPPRQQRQAVSPLNQSSGGTGMGFLSNLWSLVVILFWLGLIGGTVYAIVKAFKSIPAENFSHWYTLLENFQGSSQEFYQLFERSVSSRQVPSFSSSHIDWPEAGIFSARREYLRIRRKDLIFDICAAPFGNGFFISWWLGPKPGFLGFIYSLPFLGPLSYFLIRPFTYYRIDTALMFQEAVHNAVLEVVDGMTQAKGLRALTESQRKPVMKSFLRG